MEVAVIILTLAGLGLAVATSLMDERRRRAQIASWALRLHHLPGENGRRY